MYRRIAETQVRELLASFPAVAILGPRQCGKTTLARMCFPGAPYFDLEQTGDRLRLEATWHQAMQAERPVLLDEAQSWPPLFPRLRGAIDADRKRLGRFVLTGSVAPGLVRQISESLAGRLALVELAPLSWPEVAPAELDAFWHRGGFPDAWQAVDTRIWGHWCRSYLDLLFERDLPELGIETRSPLLKRLATMVAHLHGTWWNASGLARSLGVSYHTVNRYVDILERTFLVRRLPPWSRNLGRRTRRRPKVYWRDTGLLHALLGVGSISALYAHPQAGLSWEGFVLEHLIRRGGGDSTPHCFATSGGLECDLLVERGREVHPVEIKLGSALDGRALKRLESVRALVGAERASYIARVAARERLGAIEVWPVEEALESWSW